MKWSKSVRLLGGRPTAGMSDTGITLPYFSKNVNGTRLFNFFNPFKN